MNTNKILFLTALGSILLAVIIIPMIIFKPWIPIDPLYVSGKIFYLRITEPLILDQIVFSQTTESGNVKTYSIKPFVIKDNNYLSDYWFKYLAKIKKLLE